jgi:hypothetical protein
VIAGMHALDEGAFQFPRIRARIDYARAIGAAGTALFASSYLDEPASTPSKWSNFRADGGPYVQSAVPTPMTWR